MPRPLTIERDPAFPELAAARPGAHTTTYVRSVAEAVAVAVRLSAERHDEIARERETSTGEETER